MSDELAETSLEPEVQAPEVEADEYDDVSEVAEPIEYEDSEEEQTEEPINDSEEIEFNQKQYKLPKEIAVAVKDMQKDYTNKTQAVAEQRKAFEAQVQFQRQNIQEFAKVVALNDQIAEVDKVDLMALSAEDPQRAQQLSFYRQGLERQRNELSQQITQKDQQSNSERQQEIAKLLEQSETVLRRDIKDWGPTLEASLLQFASINYGVDQGDFETGKTNPSMMKLLHDAYIGKQLIQKQINKPKVVTAAKPVTNLSSKGARVTRDPTQMNDAEFAAWRRKTIQKR